MVRIKVIFLCALIFSVLLSWRFFLLTMNSREDIRPSSLERKITILRQRRINEWCKKHHSKKGRITHQEWMAFEKRLGAPSNGSHQPLAWWSGMYVQRNQKFMFCV